ncbi:MAG: endonuclease III, partial [bacterium]
MDQRTKKILAILEKEYGDLKPGLTYESPFQLLIAVILSAQCT